MRKLAAIFALALLSNLPLHAQRTSERIEVLLVEVPVNVVRDGEHVRNLTAANFEVYDQGQKREITNFEMIDFSQRAAAASPAAVSSPAARRKFLVLFDTANSSPSSLVRARGAALNFVSNQLLSSDRVAVATMGIEDGFRLLSGFTTDRQLTRHAIETLGAQKFYRVADPLLLAVTTLLETVAFTDAPSATPTGGSDGRVRDEMAERYKDIARMHKKLASEGQKQNILRQLDHIIELGWALDRVSGKKQVILLSEGFDPKMLHGREAGSSAEQREEMDDVARGDVWKVDSDNRYGGSETMSGLYRMIDALRRSDVVLHAIDIKGVRGPDATGGNESIATGVSPRSQESLHLLTRDTGGTVFKNANDLTSDFERMLKSQEVTYVLGFHAPSGTPGKFHKLEVKLVGVPKARVSHRIGYSEPSPATQNLDRTFSAGEIVMNSIPVDQIPMRGMAAAVPSSSGPPHVAIMLEIDGKALLQDRRAKTVSTDALIYAFDEQEVIRDFAYERISLDLGKLQDKLARNGVKFYQTLRLTPGNYSLRVLLRSADGQRNGFRSIPLRVPRAGEPYVMPPLLFDDTSGWVMVKAPDRDPAFGYPFQVGTDTFVPAVRPAVSKGGTYTVAVFAYQVKGTVNAQASIDDGMAPKSVPMSFLGRAPDGSGAVKLVYELKLPQLAHGEYSLVLDVRDAGGRQSKVTMPFVVN
jgi:VWFA-related protein